MVMLTAAGDTAGDTSGDISGVPASRPAGAGCGPNPEAAASDGGEVSPARVEVRPAAAGVEIALRGELGCGDAAVLSCQLHHRLDLGATMITVDARAVIGCAPGIARVLIVATERAQAAHIALRVIDPEGRLRPPTRRTAATGDDRAGRSDRGRPRRPARRNPPTRHRRHHHSHRRGRRDR